MGRDHPEERWAAACIETALPGVTTRRHDDGSSAGLYDLDLMRDGVAFAACEVTAAGDADAIELWNVANGSDERWIETGLRGGWVLTLAPSCNVKRLRRLAPAALRRLEDDRHDASAAADLRVLGVIDAHQGGTSFPGSIYLTLDRAPELTGGVVARTGDGLARWFEEWIREPAQAHNLEKLARARHAERHLFVLFPGLTSAPFAASDLLMRDEAPLPTAAPDVPDVLTHLWFMSTLDSGAVFHWSEAGWARFPKTFDASSSADSGIASSGRSA